MKLDLKHLRSVAEAAMLGPKLECDERVKAFSNYYTFINPTVALALISRIEKLEGALKHILTAHEHCPCHTYAQKALEGGDT